MIALRRFIAFAIGMLLAACATLPKSPASETAQLTAMTFNIRLDVASDGPNAWPHRKAMVAEVIRHEAPDLIGMQEVLLHQKRDLEVALPHYAFAGVARDDGVEAGEFSPVGWRRDRFEMLEAGTFWLSPTPHVPGKAWDAAYPRIASWVFLRDKVSGRQLRVLNTHFDHVGTAARLNAARMIADWVAKDDTPVIVMGDFNVSAGSEPYKVLATTRQSGLADARSITRTPPYGPPGTFTGFDIAAAPDRPIDHIFVTEDFAVDGFAVLTQHWGGRLPSDHYPVVAKMEFKP